MDSTMMLMDVFSAACAAYCAYTWVRLLLAAGVIIIKMCSLNTYGVPYMAPISPYNPRSSRDMLFRAGWKRLQKGDVTVQGLNGSELSGGQNA